MKKATQDVINRRLKITPPYKTIKFEERRLVTKMNNRHISIRKSDKLNCANFPVRAIDQRPLGARFDVMVLMPLCL